MDSFVAIIGGGPAGLTAAYLLSKQGLANVVLEADPEYLGGISRTVRYKGFGFDIGGHRFFSKSEEIENFWTEILGAEMLERPRSSRIFYRGKFFAYPLKPIEAFLKLGPLESLLCLMSYLRKKIFPIRNPRSFEDWVSNQFGARLFRIFFKTYTEKVWGIPCDQISADWAAQRIKGLSLGKAVLNAFGFGKNREATVKTLIESFRYPRLGPGMMWEATAAKAEAMGAKILQGHKVVGLKYLAEKKLWELTTVHEGKTLHLTAQHVISSAPLREVAQALDPPLKSEALAEKLSYRDFITVGLIVKERHRFTDNWIYIHEPQVKVGRIQNFKSWSPDMVPDPAMANLGMEYFCFKNDGMWNQSDAELIQLARMEIAQLGLAAAEDVVDGVVIRQEKAYPVYDDQYRSRVEAVRREIEADYPNLHLVGRNGMHKYNNQDHAMMTAMLTVKNIIAGQRIFDVWNVNEDAEYHEEKKLAAVSSALRQVPRKL